METTCALAEEREGRGEARGGRHLRRGDEGHLRRHGAGRKAGDELVGRDVHHGVVGVEGVDLLAVGEGRAGVVLENGRARARAAVSNSSIHIQAEVRATVLLV